MSKNCWVKSRIHTKIGWISNQSFTPLIRSKPKLMESKSIHNSLWGLGLELFHLFWLSLLVLQALAHTTNHLHLSSGLNLKFDLEMLICIRKWRSSWRLFHLEIRGWVMLLCGYKDGGESSSEGSAMNGGRGSYPYYAGTSFPINSIKYIVYMYIHKNYMLYICPCFHGCCHI